MELIPNIKKQLLRLSSELETSPDFLENILILGLNVGQTATVDQRTNLMAQLGFSQKSGLWQKQDEIYDSCMEISPLGYLSLGEINDWRLSIINQCKTKNIALRLPSAMSLSSADSQLVRQLLKNLLNDGSPLPVLFTQHESAREQAALYVAFGLLSWPQAWLLLFEEMRNQNQLTDPSIHQTVSVIIDEHNLDEVVLIINALSARINSTVVMDEMGDSNIAGDKLTFLLASFRELSIS